MQANPSGVEEKASAPGKRSTHIRWDEETIAEHDKYRGTRQKIEEPPTPYHAPVELADSDSETSRRGSGTGTPNTKRGGPGYLAEHWETLTTALEAAASHQSSTGSLRHRTGSMDDSGSSHASASHQGGGSGASSGPPSASSTHRRASFSAKVAVEEDDGNKPRTPVEQKRFSDKRLNHYDEFKRLQEWRAKRASMSDEDEDDEDEEDKKAEGQVGGAKATR